MVNGMTDKQAVIELCLRNALRYARGEIKYTNDLHAQLKYAYENSSPAVRDVMHTVFDILKLDDE
jgi:hypothetical protein